ncbi:transposase [Salinarimonas ramus]|uniref:transposase n=1 Tax=Salinarimonas ramus TaxID=690164 RepID=UPI00166516B8|nr:transposase [Salinarimonas ramus]
MTELDHEAIGRLTAAIDVLGRETDGMSLIGASVLLQVLSINTLGSPATIDGVASALGMTYSAVRKHIENLRGHDRHRGAWVETIEPVGDRRQIQLVASERAKKIAREMCVLLDPSTPDVRSPPRPRRPNGADEPRFLDACFRPETGPGPGDGVTDEEWAHLEPILRHYLHPGPKTDLRSVIDAYLYKITTNASWLALPKSFPPRSTVWSILNPRRAPFARYMVDRELQPLVERRWSALPPGYRPPERSRRRRL